VHACTPNPKDENEKIFTISLAWKVGSPFHPPPGVLLDGRKKQTTPSKTTLGFRAAER
jgi:hypothetical protein